MNEERVVLAAAVASAHQRLAWIRHRKDNGDETERVVEIYRYDEQYLDTYCRLRGAFRSFRIDHVTEIRVLENSFERTPEIAREVNVRGFSVPWEELWVWVERMGVRHEKALKEESLALLLGADDPVGVSVTKTSER